MRARLSLIALVVVATLALGPAAVAADRPEVRTAEGALSGTLDGDIRVFKNIPFAAPPVGPLRWRPPAPPVAWEGVRDAAEYGPACPQPNREDGLGGGRAARQSEDCLTVNVWAPRGARNLPVMVWIHGGAHRIGSGTFPIYDGAAFARQGVVLVTINYRLGYLGYFAHPALTAEAGADAPLGNYGFLDQVAALRWVERNIATFGGDPGQVTAFGESAGAASLLYLVSSPMTRGLIDRAIVQSGGGLQNPQGLAQQEQLGVQAASRIGLPAAATAAELRALPPEKWIEAQGQLQGGGLGFGPFIDGRAITEAPWQAFEAGRAADIPLLIGANSNEASVLGTLGVGPGAVLAFAGPELPRMRTAYGAPPLDNSEFARQALGDATFVGPARYIAGQAARGAPSFLYHFSYVAVLRRNQVPGAAHGSEIPYVFQTWDKLGIPPAAVRPQDRAMARMMSACWVAFAKSGRPACDGAPDWPAYDSTRDELMEFGVDTGVRANFRRPQLDFIIDRMVSLRTP